MWRNITVIRYRATLFFAALAITAQTAWADTKQDYPVSELFVMAADRAMIEDGRLTLSGLASSVLWFTDRPARRAGRAETEAFVANWPVGDDSFEVDPPNAVLVGHLDGESRELALELLEPAWHGKDLSLNVIALAESLPDRLQLSDVHLFIDNGAAPADWCGGECYAIYWQGGR